MLHRYLRDTPWYAELTPEENVNAMFVSITEEESETLDPHIPTFEHLLAIQEELVNCFRALSEYNSHLSNTDASDDERCSSAFSERYAASF